MGISRRLWYIDVNGDEEMIRVKDKKGIVILFIVLLIVIANVGKKEALPWIIGGTTSVIGGASAVGAGALGILSWPLVGLILGGAFWIMFVSTLFYVSLIYITLVIIHYILARDRIGWLLSR